ncbi:hypothetical protein QTO30_02035 [Yoonia sp. GPGPB17]|uniref:hypothetical protein n=1 Tax=Yoonia sp. GPGPB17 TaxID=3026147 RepID=UPI0030BB19CF
MMNTTTFSAIALIATATIAFADGSTASDYADSRVIEFCGADHVNEMQAEDDVRANPDGYFVVSLQEQVSLGDPRIILTTADTPYLCTRSAATPDMDQTNALQNADTRVVSWLFVPARPNGN